VSDAVSVGWWWGKVRETRGADLRDIDRVLDAAAVDDTGRVTALGTCKWTAGPLPYSEKTKLDAIAAHLLPSGPAPELYFFARNGVDEPLAYEARVSARIHVVVPEQLFE
jgi:hypothetical protein